MRADSRSPRRHRLLVPTLACVFSAACGSTVPASSQLAGAGSLDAPTSAEPGLGAAGQADQPMWGSGEQAGTGRTPGGEEPSATKGPGLAQPGDASASVGGAPSGVPGDTTKPVDIGFVVSDSVDAYFAAMGFSGVTTGDTRNQVNALVRHVNADGGLRGRTINPVFYNAKVTDPASQTEAAACAAFTQDHSVFAAVAPVGTAGLAKCLAKAGVVFIETYPGQAESVVRAVRGHYYDPPDFTLERFAREYVDQLVKLAFLSPESRIGLLTMDSPEHEALTERVIKPALAARGLKLTDQAAFDQTNYASQGPAFVLRFKTSGVTHVLNLSTGLIVLFQQAAENQQYRPRYALSSRDGPGAFVQLLAPPAQLRDSIGIGWQPTADVDVEHAPGDVSANQTLCRRIMKGAGEDMTSGTTVVMSHRYCEGVFFLQFLSARSDALTAPSLAGTAAGLGSAYPSVLTFRTFFSADRVDGPSRIRPLAYRTDCSCFVYSGPPRETS